MLISRFRGCAEYHLIDISGWLALGDVYANAWGAVTAWSAECLKVNIRISLMWPGGRWWMCLNGHHTWSFLLWLRISRVCSLVWELRKCLSWVVCRLTCHVFKVDTYHFPYTLGCESHSAAWSEKFITSHPGWLILENSVGGLILFKHPAEFKFFHHHRNNPLGCNN